MKPVKCTVKYFCFGSFMIFLGSVLLCALGITIVLPYHKTKDWIAVTCDVISAAYNQTVCSCDQQDSRTDCYEIYPCLQIRVTYKYHVDVDIQRNRTKIIGDLNEAQMKMFDSDGVFMSENGEMLDYYSSVNYNNNGGDDDQYYYSNKKNRVNDNKDTLNNGEGYDYEDYGSNNNTQNARAVVRRKLLTFEQAATLYKTWSDSFYKTCSLHVCDETQWNKKEASRFHKLRGQPGMEYQCYANPQELQTVILDKIPYENSVHAILWPVLFLLCGVFVWGGLYVGCAVIETAEKTYTPHRTNISLL